MNNQLRNEPATPALIMPTPAHTALETAPPPAPVEGEFVSLADSEIARIRGLQHEHETKMSGVGRELHQLQQSLATETDVEEVQKKQSRINALISVLKVLTVEQSKLQKLFDEASEKRRSVDAERNYYTIRKQKIEEALQSGFNEEYNAEDRLVSVRRVRPQLQAELAQIEDLLIRCGKATGFAHSFNPNDAPLSVIMPVIR